MSQEGARVVGLQGAGCRPGLIITRGQLGSNAVMDATMRGAEDTRHGKGLTSYKRFKVREILAFGTYTKSFMSLR